MLSCSGDIWKEPQTAEKVLFFFFFSEGHEAVWEQAAKALVFLLLLLFLIGVELLYKIVLISAVQQNEWAIFIHISPLSWISLPHPTSII